MIIPILGCDGVPLEGNSIIIKQLNSSKIFVELIIGIFNNLQSNPSYFKIYHAESGERLLTSVLPRWALTIFRIELSPDFAEICL